VERRRIILEDHYPDRVKNHVVMIMAIFLVNVVRYLYTLTWMLISQYCVM
jgi:hypothetical protein